MPYQQESHNSLDNKYKPVWVGFTAVMAVAVLVLLHELLTAMTRDYRVVGAVSLIVICLIALYPARHYGRKQLAEAYHAGKQDGIREEKELASRLAETKLPTGEATPSEDRR
ncbi:hypothetical protein ACIRP3_33720 [Streptomyces sp. NPDC101209]|uniref:hypothetical protein n=1 Tax=Streptomyces sp. NPDC101209 TaxID=3366129 RepID=UPI00380D2908